MATQAQAKQLQKKQTSAARTVNRSKAKRQISRKNTPIAPAYLQAKLNISSPDDPHEREADQVADSVMRMPVQRSVTGSINRASLKPGITPINRAISAEISRDSLKPGEQLIHRDSLKPGNESIQRKADASTSISSNTTENKINAKLGQGDKLPATVRESMEARFGHDFSEVRIHSDNEAAELSQNIEAKAFTVGNDIFFASGQFEPNSDEGQRLLAHELTHVVQQSGAGNTGVAQQKIQRFSFRGAWDAVSGAVSSAVEFVGDSISAGLDWIKEHLSGLVSSMPGYSLLAVMLGEDPITGAAVARTGRNFIEAGLDVIPNGAVLKAKLEEKGALAEAASWLDEQIAILEFSPSAILRSLGNFFSGLSLSDIASPAAVFSRLKNIVVPPIVRLATFAITVASKLLEIVKNYILDNLVTFVKEQTRAYPLLTVILGKDPITDEQVDRTPIALLRGFMLLSESGEEQLRQMEESGSLQRAADWVNGALERLNITWDIIKQIFINAWEAITFQSVFPNPLVAFTRIVNIIAPPALRIINFVIEVALKVLGFIKDALISRLVSFARGTRGYTLLTVILGKDPFSGEQVERSTENIIKGFMLLTSGGEEQFKQMKETGAITRMSARIETAIATLAFTWAYIRGLFTTAWESFTLSMLAQPLQAFARILAVFADPFLRLVSFVIEIVKVVVEVILRVMNFPINLVNNIITKAMQAFTNIKRNPIGFLMNLLRAVRQGFEQFFGNITDHLISGVVDWLFGQLSDAGITPPQDLSFRSILGLVLEVLNLTIERIWEKLEERIGPERMARVRSMIDRLTGAWAFVKDVVTRGPIAIWEYIQERLSSLWDTVLESIRNWIVTRIIERVTTKLLSMLDPTGIMAVVNGFMAFFNAIQSFIRYLREMLQIVNSFVEGVAEIAAGSVASAANFLENALGRAVPIAIGFLANQVGLSDLGRRIGEMIGRVRDMVDQALTWLVDKAVSAGSSLINMGRSAISAVTEWWRKRKPFRTASGESHSLYTEGDENNLRFMVASHPTNYREFLDQLIISNNDPKKAEKQVAKTNAESLFSSLVRLSSEQTSSNNANQAQEGQSEEFDQQLNSLAENTAVLMEGAVDSPISSPPVYGGLTSAGYGTSMFTPRLAKTGPNGSSPSSSLTTESFEKLNQRRTARGASYYIKGHLLNDNVHGPGNTWQNLTPLTRWTNNNDPDSHLKAVEKYVKEEVNDKERIVEYKIEAIYDRPLNNAYIAALDNGTDPNKEKKKQIIRAERLIPSKLKANASIVGVTRAEDQQMTLPNKFIDNIDVNNSARIDTPLDQYFVDGESEVSRTYKSISINAERNRSKSNKTEAVKALSSDVISNVGAGRIDLILETPEPMNFTSFDSMRERIQQYAMNDVYAGNSASASRAATIIYNALANNDKVRLNGETEIE